MTLRYWHTFSSLAVPVQTEAKQIEVQQTKTKENAPSIVVLILQSLNYDDCLSAFALLLIFIQINVRTR